MYTLTAPFTVFARVLLAMMFVLAGWSKLTNFDATVAYIAAHQLPLASVVAALTLTLEMVGGIAIMVGFKARIAAFLLGGFTILAAIIFHAYWAAPADQAYVQQLMFMKNMSIAGGLFLLAALGSGAWSLDQKRAV